MHPLEFRNIGVSRNLWNLLKLCLGMVLRTSKAMYPLGVAASLPSFRWPTVVLWIKQPAGNCHKFSYGEFFLASWQFQLTT